MLRLPFPDAGRLGGLALAGGVLAVLGGGGRVRRDGPPPAHTGGFGEPTCRQCHFDSQLNAPGGELVLRGLPDRYVAGQSYELTLLLRRAGMLRGGFQLAARFADGRAVGTQAGSLEPMDSLVAVVRDTTAVQYLEHTRAGTALTPGSDSARWTFRWAAPASASGAVIFHVAANAANDDDSPLGDYIYTTSARASPTQP